MLLGCGGGGQRGFGLKLQIHLKRQTPRSYTSASQVRQQFLDWMMLHSSIPHTLLKPSPVLPKNDPSLSFVNSGMVQFKPVFQGRRSRPCARGTNSQRCVRVGGKHNDLSVVGSDGTHLTMFEMLGSWSFGDYWKEEACKSAWKLITEGYGLSPDNLWVTYFKGCPQMGLKADLETKEVWSELGIKPERIIGLGMEDNFWEMGMSGPCGPCTEIHYCREKEGKLEDATELWNLVFMEWDRKPESGELEPLASRFVDTGMGLERLTAVLNGEDSVYNTDLFSPLMGVIRKASKCEQYRGTFGPGATLDTGYRIVADHARMCTVALADGATPDTHNRVRTVLRRALGASKQVFGVEEGLLGALAVEVVDSLGSHHDLSKRLSRVQTILEFEEKSYQGLMERQQSYLEKLQQDFASLATYVPFEEARGYHEAFTLLSNEPSATLPTDLAFRLLDSHGLQEDDVVAIANLTHRSLSLEDLRERVKEQKRKSKLSTAQIEVEKRRKVGTKRKLPPTDDSSKYNYFKDKAGTYSFPRVRSEVLEIEGEEGESDLKVGDKGAVVLDATCCYAEKGGQAGDKGFLTWGERQGRFKVEDTQEEEGVVRHWGTLESGQLVLGSEVEVEVDSEWRVRCMRNHTATHLINSALHSILPVTCQRSSFVSANYLRFDFSVYGTSFGVENVRKLEEMVSKAIAAKDEVERKICDSADALSREEVVTVPGATYPETISMIEVAGVSAEPCAGTHLRNTGEVGSLVVTKCSTPATGLRSIRALTGPEAESALEVAQEVDDQLSMLEKDLEGERMEQMQSNQLEEVAKKLTEIRSKLEAPDFPLLASHSIQTRLETLQKAIQVIFLIC